MKNYQLAPQTNKIANRQDYEYIVMSEDGKSEGLSFKVYLHIIRRRKWFIFSPLFITISIALLFVVSSEKTYNATTRLLIEEIGPRAILMQEARMQEARTSEHTVEFYNTQYEIIKSRSIAEEVVQTLQLDKRDSPKSPRLVQAINTIVNFPTMLINKAINSVSEVLSSGETTREDSNLSPIQAPNSNNPRLEGAIARLRSRLTVLPVKDTKLVDISLQGSDPLEVARQVDMVADVYIRRNLEEKLDITRKAVIWLKREVDTWKEKTKIAQLSLQEFNENKKLTFNENNSNIGQQQLDALNSSYIETRTSRIKIQAILGDIDKLSKKGVEEVIEYPVFLENPVIRLLRTKYMELKIQYNSLSNIYKDQHVKIVQIKSEMEDVKNNIFNEVNTIKNSMQKDYNSLLTKEESIKKNLDKQQREALIVNKDFTKYNDIKRDIDMGKEFYLSLSKKLAETTLTEVLEDNNIKVVEKARIPTQPISSGGAKKILLAVMLGLGFGGCLAFVAEHFDKRFKTIDDAERELEMPFVGFIPRFKIDRHKANKLIALQDPTAIVSEAYRTIRTWVCLSKPKEGNTLLITSATPQEGKSATAANLAVSFAQLGSTVLLVDADLRRPTLDRIFNLEECMGLTEVLMLGVDWKEVIQTTDIDNLKILLTGTPPSNPTEILSTIRMKELIHTWRKCFDIIIFDSPIALSISDVSVLASEMDRILLVHCPSKTGKEEVIEATRRLRSIYANIDGIIFNNLSSRELKNYYLQVPAYNYYSSSKGVSRIKRIG